jgi:glycosyltransferase involved in cell wall biosynthesis
LVGPAALMCGTPAVSYAVGGVPEIAEASVGMVLAPAGDLDALATATRTLLADVAADPTLRRRIRRAALDRFSLDARLDALESTFRALATARDALTA